MARLLGARWLVLLPLAPATLVTLSSAHGTAAQDPSMDIGGAFVAGDECSAERGGACALNALQLHGQRVAGETSAAEAGGSCNAYGCCGYKSSHACQCNPKCAHYGNCCSDYASTCAAKAGRGSCRAYGCGRYETHHSCQCNHLCAKFGNCCKDFTETCTALAGARVHGHPSASKRYQTYPGFALTLVEEFDSPIDLERDPIWTWSDGGLIEGQIRYVKEAIHFEDGRLKIEVSNRSHWRTQACSHAEASVIPHKELSSGELRTRHNMFRYGRYEARIKAPSVQPGNTRINGNFVATLFVFRDGKFRHWREVDVEITGETVDSLHTNVLSADHKSKWSEEMDEEKAAAVGTNVRAGFHTYAIEWLPHRIRWYFDDKLIREKTGGKVPIPSLSTKIMMNTWVFDHRALFGGKEIWNDHFPLHTEYEWFRFYRWEGDRHYPCADLGTQCLTPDDRYLSSNNPCDGIPQEGTIQGKAVCVAKCHRERAPGGTSVGEAVGSCKAYGCCGYKSSHACQCNEKCVHYGDCCSDYASTCAAKAE